MQTIRRGAAETTTPGKPSGADSPSCETNIHCSTPSAPTFVSRVSHMRSCDPVVASGNFAFVTLNTSTGSWCGMRGDVLQIYDIADSSSPRLILEQSMSSPRGLAVDGENSLVFVCDNGMVRAFDFDAAGYDPDDYYSRVSVSQKFVSNEMPDVRRIDAYDCIALDPVLPNTLGTLLVIGADGLYQLGYDTQKFTFISKIDIRNR